MQRSSGLHARLPERRPCHPSTANPGGGEVALHPLREAETAGIIRYPEHGVEGLSIGREAFTRGNAVDLSRARCAWSVLCDREAEPAPGPMDAANVIHITRP